MFKLLLVSAVLLAASTSVLSQLPQSCSSEIYCYGELLHTVQMSRINGTATDTKAFVDMSLKFTYDVTLSNFQTVMTGAGGNPSVAQVKQFVDDNFVAGNELEEFNLTDFNPSPALLAKNMKPEIKEFAKDLIAIWAKLGKKIVIGNPAQYSIIPVPNGFVVPGGRFREFYYWDSYFILEGLLISEMFTTSKGMLDNFLSMVHTYGFVPNGGRIYYLNRSQPPFLTPMAKLYYDYTGNIEWVRQNLPLLEKELLFWNGNMVTVIKNGFSHQVARYKAASQGPRPESYYEDVMTAQSITDPTLKQDMYTELKSAAESGWDFSSRWFFDSNGDFDSNLQHIQTTRVIPVDLNAILGKAYKEISDLYFATGQIFKGVEWFIRYIKMKFAIDAVFWNNVDGIWYDFDYTLKRHRNGFYVSNLSPLWAKMFIPKVDLCTKILNYLKTVGILTPEGVPAFPGGIPTSLIKSGQQWDLPNAWPPLQQIFVEALENLKCQSASDLAKILAVNWVEANHMGYVASNGNMFEKYDATVKGQYGGGGEYTVQSGFGWSNGVVLKFIKAYFTS